MKSLRYLAILVLITFCSCRKGDGDPVISFRSRTCRLTGEWKFKSGKYVFKDDINTFEATYNDGVYSTNQGESGTYTWEININKDGTWKEIHTETSTVPTNSTSTEIYEGKWNWIEGIGDVKSKSQVIFFSLKLNNNVYTGSEAPAKVWDLYQLKNDEIIIKGSGTSNTYAGNYSTQYEFTLVKK